ncbi:GNAT family N-acetyltransferase [Desulfococcaceae bacterium HSG8]|nr:GNAT family N-acetyltransferase [Desulfococcaceae bacterium HSG8]
MDNNSPIKIIPFSKDYRDQVIHLIVNIQQKEFEIAIMADDQPDLHDIPGYYQKGTGNFWIAVHNNEVVGTISLLDISDNQAALRKMFVQRDYRGQKIGTALRLLDTLLSWAKSHEVQEIYLGTTPKFLAAHRFYEKSGFSEIPKSHLPGAFPVMEVDTKFYKYML